MAVGHGYPDVVILAVVPPLGAKYPNFLFFQTSISPLGFLCRKGKGNSLFIFDFVCCKLTIVVTGVDFNRDWFC